jgi:3-hydroxyisobutyrate dehydrogenase-like beta-hydroxyacid dehydrogenase
MKIAFLGTGLMGGPMAKNLAVSGFHVSAWNRTPSNGLLLGTAFCGLIRLSLKRCLRVLIGGA